ncbi:MAG: DUF1640 domain-containing protein [Clostridia bacterium]|nr:DUF1640 domain-containing protein [Clostridia bacterium]MBQ3196189.1 DUF1640 domain-containing protein [Clostridia bacterium]
MTTITFDSLNYAKKLEAAGFTREQAEVQTQAIREVIEEQLATKRDLKDLETSLEGKLRDLEYRLTIRLGAMIAAAVATVATLVKLL